MKELPPKTKINVQPMTVEYRLASGLGVRVHRVLLTGSEPRIIAQTERLVHDLEITPMSLSLAEAEFYISDALRRVGRSPSGMSPEGEK